MNNTTLIMQVEQCSISAEIQLHHLDSCSWSFNMFHHQLVNKQIHSSVTQTQWLVGSTPSCVQFIIVWGYPLWLFWVLLFWITTLYAHIKISERGFRVAGLKKIRRYNWKTFHLKLLGRTSAWKD